MARKESQGTDMRLKIDQKLQLIHGGDETTFIEEMNKLIARASPCDLIKFSNFSKDKKNSWAKNVWLKLHGVTHENNIIHFSTHI